MNTPASSIDLSYELDDRYARERGRIFLSGVQALVRLPLMQRGRDQAAGLNTAGFISGYRGSPLGGLDLNLWKARRFLQQGSIEFAAGLNEDLAATAVWGSQQVNLWPGAKFDGVYSMWYGKGPGVDRAGDVLKHANAAGTSANGGVLVLCGDDHACRSSTLPHQSEHELISAMMPVLNPAGVQDILDMGLYGWAMSRFTGRWVGFKTIAETVESSASVNVDPTALHIVLPEDFVLPQGGLNIRWPDPPMEQEMRLHRYAMDAARAFARANKLDRVVFNAPQRKLGIITTGKSYLDVLQALEYLGMSFEQAAEAGLSLYKVGMSWPLEPEGIRAFADGHEELIVVEEKRSFIEKQVKEQLYNATTRPRIIGKYDEQGEWVLPSTGELTPARIARLLAKRLQPFFTSDQIRERLAFLDSKEQELAKPTHDFGRTPHFCSGCPHNSSTKVPEGSRAVAGIGCHYMVTWMDRRTETFTQMGGEGVPWIGQAPFTETEHVFVNLGDGTYFHSGSLALRAVVAAKVNATFKILYNDAVAMTGGQPVDGSLSVVDIARQVRAEGVETIVVVSNEPEKWSKPEIFPEGVAFEHRDDMARIQKNLRETKGVSVLIYDQTCAAELRRRRKRKLVVDPPKRVMINQAVCEGCGDCSEKSNCLSVVPVETELGRKRAIDQSSCNKDFSCVKGFCPSFVTVEGGTLKKRSGSDAGEIDFDNLPMPQLPSLDKPVNILVTGVGGTGVVTIGALLGMAAHIEGKGSSVLDQTGLAQKGGAVTSHVRIGATPEAINAVRIAAGEADLVLGCDLVVAASFDVLAKMRQQRTHAVVNTHETMPGQFTRNADLQFPGKAMMEAVHKAVGDAGTDFVDATAIASALMGDSIASNLFMLGYAWQQGKVPVTLDALMRAIELNGVAIEFNRRAFQWGRLMALQPDTVREAAKPAMPKTELLTDLSEKQSFRRDFLVQYQNEAYAQRYDALVDKVRQAEQAVAPNSDALTTAVTKYFFKLMAYKDEYEVARLYTDGRFQKQLSDTFEDGYKLRFHLAPPLLSKRDDEGHLVKKTYGPWMLKAFGLLAKMKGLRGTKLDVFGYTEERRTERALIGEYEQLISELLPKLTPGNLSISVELASLPEQLRGFGHVKEANLERLREQQQALLEAFSKPSAVDSQAA
jgi:indolepyruvate ferredoxin oxidoreductase